MTNFNFGRCLMIGFSGLKPSDEFLNFVANEKIGSVILFAENYESPKQIKDIISEIKSANPEVLIAVDQEGGKVIRFSEPFTHFPPMWKVALKDNISLVRDVGEALGSELSAVGVDWNLAPVLDVNIDPNNPVIGDRSFGDDPVKVTYNAIALMDGLKAAGILTCGKHFPGHGNTNLDSHFELPIINNPKNVWERIDLVPFEQAIKAGIPAIMTAHIMAPAIDDKNIASISPNIIGGILREYLGFNGVVLSDDLNMKGISNQMSIPEASLRAIQAGSDMVIIRSDLDIQKQTLNVFKNSESKGIFNSKSIDSIRRHLDGLLEERSKISKTHSMEVVGCDQHKGILESI